MIVKKYVTNNLFQKCRRAVFKIQTGKIHNRALIGNRDWVGFGIKGSACYFDHLLYPCPAVRFKENTNELLALREKEKGDWRKLTIEEKKTLYRASFRQTFEEILAPTGIWKTGFSAVFFTLGLTAWLLFFENEYLVRPLPPTFSEEHRAQTVRALLDLRVGHLSGISSKWDYEKDDWKK